MGARDLLPVESVATLSAGLRIRAKRFASLDVWCLRTRIGSRGSKRSTDVVRYGAAVRLSVEPSLDAATYPFHHRIRVRFAETDAMGIVHHSRYLPYLEEGRVEYLRHLGHPYSEMRSAGLDYAVLECFVQYRQPLRFDEEVDVHLALASTTRTSFQMAYLLTVLDGDDAVVRATAVTVHGCVNAAGRPERLPAWLVDLAP
jgi:acyl-CoA thioester hydrolase